MGLTVNWDSTRKLAVNWDLDTSVNNEKGMILVTVAFPAHSKKSQQIWADVTACLLFAKHAKDFGTEQHYIVG